MPVGDVNSSERGSGARFNDGKPAMELIPMGVLALHAEHRGFGDLASMLNRLHDFQMSGGYSRGSLHEALRLAMNPITLTACARVFDYGRRKYAEWNWLKGMAWSVPLGCIGRHALAIIDGEEIDPESGLPHHGHLMCNLVMLWQFTHTYSEGNDLPSVPLPAEVMRGRAARKDAEDSRCGFGEYLATGRMPE